jgi:hypothetical protein
MFLQTSRKDILKHKDARIRNKYSILSASLWFIILFHNSKTPTAENTVGVLLL